MNSQTLVLSGLNLNNNQPFQKLIRTSNVFMLGLKYQALDQNLFIESWTLINNEWEGGNSSMNAGSYLHVTLEELTGCKL